MTELERFEPPFCTRPLTKLIGPPYGKGKGQDLETGKRVEVTRDSASADGKEALV